MATRAAATLAFEFSSSGQSKGRPRVHVLPPSPWLRPRRITSAARERENRGANSAGIMRLRNSAEARTVAQRLPPASLASPMGRGCVCRLIWNISTVLGHERLRRGRQLRMGTTLYAAEQLPRLQASEPGDFRRDMN